MSNSLSMPEPTRLVLCADDFALTQGISRGILRLLERGKLSATGAMTNRPHWRGLAAALCQHADQADLGVHLNLTCASPLTPMPLVAPRGELPDLKTVMRLAMTSAAARAEMAREIEAQLEAFSQATGRAPDFIDGHQHVHALPGVRRVVIAVASRLYRDRSPYLRDPSDHVSRIMARRICTAKALTISTLASGFGAAARQAGFATNDGFSGVSDFAAEGDFLAALGHYATAPGLRHLVMCHPGDIDDELPRLDPVIASRPVELHALEVADFQAIGIKLVRFRMFFAG
jgi:chitin disaccharide deacetylase